MVFLLLEGDGNGGQVASVSSSEILDPLSGDVMQLKLPAHAVSDRVAAEAYVQTLANILRNGGASVTVEMS